jgi:flagellin-like protein
MQLRQLRNDDDAVSPVIGVILMVAITVILAAVIATFVLGLGEQVSSTAPQASFSFDYDNSSSGSSGNLTIAHSGGATLNIENVAVQVADNSSVNISSWPGGDNEITAGDSVTVNATSGDSVRITWTNDQGTDSATLREYVVG